MTPLDLWADALRQAYGLARGERLNELRGARRARMLDARGLHPYSEQWGRVHACEQLEPLLTEVRNLGPVCDSVVLRSEARRDAEGLFLGEVDEHGREAFAA